jgi:hypothetical protein
MDSPDDQKMQPKMMDSRESEEMISTELARANLARLRGDYDTAEELCVALLRKAPNDANVAALLGDVSMEQNKLDAAIQWYEMSVESGAPTGIEEKLATVQKRLKAQDEAASEAGIGLAPRSILSPATLLAGIIVMIMLFVAVYVAGTNHTPSKPVSNQEQTPIIVPPSNPQTPVRQAVTDSSAASNPATQDNPSPTETHPLGTQPARPTMDADLASVLGDGVGIMSRVTNAISDPRTHSVVIDATLQPGDDPRAVAAQIAEATLGKLKDAPNATIRLMSTGKPDFVADASREKFDAYLHAGRTAGTGSELADALLTNEWKASGEALATGR